MSFLRFCRSIFLRLGPWVGPGRQPRCWLVLGVAPLLPLLRAAEPPAKSVWPDLATVPADLTVPTTQATPPAPGVRSVQTTAGWANTAVHHTLYLPSDWAPGKKYPVLVEYAGNGPYRNAYGDVSDGTVEGCRLGYGISGGRGFLWVCLPFVAVEGTAQRNATQWWGDIAATKRYCLTTVRDVCARWGGDERAVIFCGFSRGAIAANYLGLRDEEIASLWRAFICASHYDGVSERWPYPDADRASARERLQRLGTRPQFILQEGSTQATREWLRASGVAGKWTFFDLPFRNHSADWVLRDIPARREVRAWLAGVLAGKPDAGGAAAAVTVFPPPAAPAGQFFNPLNPGADPWLGFAQGRYHLATTQGSCVRLWSAPSLAGLATAEPQLVWERGRSVWAPEFNRLPGPNGWRWYCYFTQTDGPDVNHRLYVAESVGEAIEGPYGEARQIRTDPANQFYAIDGHVYVAADGRAYLLWAGHPGHRIFIARLRDPFTLETDRVLIPASGFGCTEVREGPFVLRHGGRAFLTYSACDTGKPDYAVGYLWQPDNADPLSPTAWKQHPEPLLRREDAHGVYGPGHHSFFTSPDGSEVWIAYHAKTVAGYTYRDRTTRAQRVEWDEHGLPRRIVPVALTTPLPLPAGDPGRGKR